MPRSTNPSISAARWLVGVIAAVVVAFLVETFVTQHIEGTIASRANAIVSNAMPSVHLLTNALGELDRIDFDLDEYAAASAADRPLLRERVTTEQHELDALLVSYAVLPSFPREAALSAHLRDEELHLDRQLEAFLRSDGGGPALTSLHRSLDNVEDSLRGVVEFDASQGQRLGLEIERIRAETTGMVALLDISSVALAVVAAVLAVRQLRRSVRGLELARSASEQREAELASRAEALGQFAGRVAHDILSPLSTTLLSLELVRPACAADPAAQRATARGIAAINRVHALVDGLLAFSRAGGHPEPGVAADIAPVIADMAGELSVQAKQQQIALEVAPVPEGRVACSSGVLTSLVSNLVNNAIRYMDDAPSRRIDVRVLDAGERWRFEVQDTGPGIPQDQQQRIFEPYVQLARGPTGIGLGLATVERLARAHGGSVGLVSPPTGGAVPGRGALFWFELPKGIVPAPVQAGASAGQGTPT